MSCLISFIRTRLQSALLSFIYTFPTKLCFVPSNSRRSAAFVPYPRDATSCWSTPQPSLPSWLHLADIGSAKLYIGSPLDTLARTLVIGKNFFSMAWARGVPIEEIRNEVRFLFITFPQEVLESESTGFLHKLRGSWILCISLMIHCYEFLFCCLRLIANVL